MFSIESRDAYAEKKLRARSQSWPILQVCALRFNRVSPRLPGRDVSFTDLRSIQHWRIAD